MSDTNKLVDRVFLGGTCNDSKWRDLLEPMLERPTFNPVVAIWTKYALENELKQRRECGIILYTITPVMNGVYSIAEVVEDSILAYLENNYGKEGVGYKHVVFTIIGSDSTTGEDAKFSEHQLKSLEAVSAMVAKYGVKTFRNLKDTAKYINGLPKVE